MFKTHYNGINVKIKKLEDFYITLIENLRQTVAEANRCVIPSADKPSIAIGIAEHIVGQNDDVETIIHRADAEMYSDKATLKRSRLR